MSHTFARPLAQRVTGALGWFTVCAAAIGTMLLACTGVPDAWWPETGHALAASHPSRTQQAPSRAEGSDACALIVGPARDYCLTSGTRVASPVTGDHAGITPGRALLLVPVAVGITAAVRLRRTAR
ncbi:hypothetical protein QCN29_26090 [Streptomyces sp. HNM0663]|uniref:Uncharacterized protein n=1 Tax=Streptomyces chengmaiensis TaxID=3040919 RepID=A0ABT6HU10_9ACTN|nr:hypothetical protein [Streptomyces chengmaiensis]MDH2392190.1 hypothetical protein [Streptomyces chengmaiensis]